MPEGPIELPRLGARSADTHAHLDMLDDPAGALERGVIAGTMFVVTVHDPSESPAEALDSVSGWLAECTERLIHWEIPHPEAPEVRVIAGVHPHNARHYDEAMRAGLVQLASHPLVAGIGETGLDFFHNHSSRDDQRRAFRDQLALANDLGRPVVVHLREAHEEGFAMLTEAGVPEAGCVVHCFTEDAETVERFLDVGCHISFAGPLTFKNADHIREALAVVPLDRLLFETDCPFLAPEPYRGRTNEPAWVTLTVDRAARLKDLPSEVVSLAALENAKRLFGAGV